MYLDLLLGLLFIGVPLLIKILKTNEEKAAQNTKGTTIKGNVQQPQKTTRGMNNKTSGQSLDAGARKQTSGLGPSDFQREIPKSPKAKEPTMVNQGSEAGSMSFESSEGFHNRADSAFGQRSKATSAYAERQDEDENDAGIYEADLRRSVIMAEVLGKPRALKRNIR